MPVQLIGILIILLLASAIFFAYRYMKAHQYKSALFVIVFLGLVLRLFIASDAGLHEWDERYHALVAKNMMDEPFKPMLYKNPVLPYDYKNWTENHIWLHKQPMTLWLMAGSMKIFGVNEFAVRLPSILLTTLGILLIFSIGKMLWNEKVGLYAAFFYAIHGLILEQTGGRVTTDHVDIAFLFFIQLGVYLALVFFERKTLWINILCGITIGLALLTKWLPALIVLPIWLIAGWNKFEGSKKSLMLQFLLLITVIVGVALPWQIYIQAQFPDEAIWESQYNFRHLIDDIENHAKPWYYYLNLIRELFGELIYLPLLWMLYGFFKKTRDYKHLILLTWIIVPLVIFSLAKTKMQGYILFSAPAYFLVAALFIEYLLQNQEKFKWKKWTPVLVVLLFALPLRYSVERIKPFRDRSADFTWMEEISQLKKSHSNLDKTLIFNTERYIEVMFYTDCIAYPFGVNPQQKEALIQKGYLVLDDFETAILPPKTLRFTQ